MKQFLNDETKLSRFVAELNTVAKAWGITPLGFSLPKDKNGFLMVSVDFGIKSEPPPLGVHVIDGVAGKDKVGG